MKEKEKFEFEETEIKAIVMIAADHLVGFLQFEAADYKDEKSARQVIEKRIMGLIDEYLDLKRGKK